ncbi:MAG: hypothetical protein ACK53Y_09835 [bacterium]|jgi:hypothetical protein
MFQVEWDYSHIREKEEQYCDIAVSHSSVSKAKTIQQHKLPIPSQTLTAFGYYETGHSFKKGLGGRES